MICNLYLISTSIELIDIFNIHIFYDFSMLDKACFIIPYR